MPFRSMLLRGAKVFARCDDGGQLVLSGGKVEIRYNAGDGKAYFAVASNLAAHPDASVRPDAEFGAAAKVARKDPEREPEAQAQRGAAGDAAGLHGGHGVTGVRVATKPLGKKAVTTVSAAPMHAEIGEAVAYADGACSGNPGPAGLGVVLLTPDTRRELSEFIGDGTNNIAELLGIQRAAEAFPDSASVLHVYTDSSYAIGVLSKGWKAKANVQLIADVKKALAKLPAWKLHHVRGHHGVPLNERADVLAVAAVSSRRSTGWVDVKS